MKTMPCTTLPTKLCCVSLTAHLSMQHFLRVLPLSTRKTQGFIMRTMQWSRIFLEMQWFDITHGAVEDIHDAFLRFFSKTIVRYSSGTRHCKIVRTGRCRGVWKEPLQLSVSRRICMVQDLSTSHSDNHSAVKVTESTVTRHRGQPKD